MMNKQTSIVLVILAIVLAVTTTLVTVTLMNDAAYADPWSWGGSPSQGWLNCYNSGSSDCTNAR